MARRKKLVPEPVFLPSSEEVVRMIAMRGFEDSEIADMFGLKHEQIQKWRKAYPSFEKALDDGRSLADYEVIAALHKRAIGTKKTKIVIKETDDGNVWEKHVEDVLGDVGAQKYWLDNRSPEKWGTKTQISLGGRKGEPIGIDGPRDETKAELVSSIMALIKPKKDDGSE